MRTTYFSTLNWSRCWLCGLLWLGVSQLASAQDSRVNVLDRGLPVGPSTNLPAAASMAAQPAADGNDLGPEQTLFRRPRPKYFDVFSDTQYAYNSNVLLTPRAALGDGELYETLSLAASPVLVPKLTSTVYVRQQFVRYSRYDVFDFDAQTAGLALSYPLRNWCSVYGGFSASRLISAQNDQEFFRQFDTVFGLWGQQKVGSRMLLYYGYQFDWLPTSVPSLDRLYNALYGGLNVPLTDKLLAQLLYRLQLQTYLGSARTDWNNLVNLTATYTFNPWVATRVFVSYGDNLSSQAVFSYRAVNAGAGLTLDFKF